MPDLSGDVRLSRYAIFQQLRNDRKWQLSSSCQSSQNGMPSAAAITVQISPLPPPPSAMQGKTLNRVGPLVLTQLCWTPWTNPQMGNVNCRVQRNDICIVEGRIGKEHMEFCYCLLYFMYTCMCTNNTWIMFIYYVYTVNIMLWFKIDIFGKCLLILK